MYGPHTYFSTVVMPILGPAPPPEFYGRNTSTICQSRRQRRPRQKRLPESRRILATQCSGRCQEFFRKSGSCALQMRLMEDALNGMQLHHSRSCAAGACCASWENRGVAHPEGSTEGRQQKAGQCPAFCLASCRRTHHHSHFSPALPATWRESCRHWPLPST